MKGKRKLTLFITALVLLVFFILPMGIAYFIYQYTFGLRYTTASHMKRQIEEFEGLKLKKYFFTSNKGQKLTAYKYYEDIFPTEKRNRYFNIKIKGENIKHIPNIEKTKLRFYVPSKHNPDNDFFVESKQNLDPDGASKEKIYHPAFVISDKWLLAIKLGYDKIYYFKGEQRKDIVNYFTGEFTTNRDEAYEFEPNNSHINDYEVTIKNWKLLNKKE